MRGIFRANVSVAAQTPRDAERFVAIGAAAAQVHVVGNIKFDVDVGAGVIERGRALRGEWGSARPTWAAGSTHAGEEEAVLDAHAALLTRRPDALLLLAPRHPARFEAVAELLRRRDLSFTRRSAATQSAVAGAASQVVLVDTVGELAALYAAADAAFVGGSLVPIGGHNLLEPAALGLPVLTGPSQANGTDIARLLLAQGAAVQVADARELAEAVVRLFGDPEERGRIGAAGRQLVAANRGSVARLIALIEPSLQGPAPPQSPAASQDWAPDRP
jgi:3-deoxy-D-manno-octulosonic-acid transferase